MIGQVAGETGMSRREIYRMLSEKSGIPLSGVHFRYMGKQQCLALIEIMKGEAFHCEICGMKMHADANAACNIAIPGIDAVIEHSLKYAGCDGEANSQLPLAN